MGPVNNGDKDMAVSKKLFYGKKGLAYTIIAIVLVVVSVAVFSSRESFKLRDETYIEEVRIQTMNEFVKDVQKDLTRGMKISSHRALLAILAHETSSGVFVQDSKASFAEAFFNGTVNGSIMDIMKNASFTNWTQRIKMQAEKIGIGIGLEAISLSVEHVSPWDISINASVIINVSDSKGAASWKIAKNLSTELSIRDFEDPLYIIKTRGRVPNVVKETDVGFSSLENLKRHINRSFYIASAAAPSYLMRLEGNLGASEFGIESIVNINEITQQDLEVFARSNVDYIYFGSQSHTNCIVNETLSSEYSWFRLDSGSEPLNHLDNYNAHCKAE